MGADLGKSGVIDMVGRLLCQCVAGPVFDGGLIIPNLGGIVENERVPSL